MRAIDLVIGAGWIAFWVGWIVAAARTKPVRRRNWRRFARVRIPVLLLVLVLLHFRAVNRPASDDPAVVAIGLALFLAGLALAVWARIHLGRNWGTPMSEKADPELVTSGPYRWLRNPIYSGIVLAMLGTAIAVSLVWLVPAVVFGCFFVYSSLMEERYMAQRFPATYPAYRSSTKMLIPFVL